VADAASENVPLAAVQVEADVFPDHAPCNVTVPPVHTLRSGPAVIPAKLIHIYI
jgi:hypothetical protein